ncbi:MULTISPECIES: hypothetical protein [Streptomyces]|uniref:hypothetical protein n=1 Tax=Streptomyces TaxID=1883 RepID=UPI000F5581B4|nr:hypothetical protein [Streptomyces sp. ADI98-10]RPK77994.1 hypothetical protein EES46_34510 [Streptomyces sp. ADI98-10]
MKLSTTLLDPLAESAVVAACALADASGSERWSEGAVEDAATALEVLAGALSELSPETAELLEVIPAAVAALREHVESTPDAATPPRSTDRAEEHPAVLSTGLRRALAAHNLTGHRVHQLGPALLTVTLDAARAQALAVLLAARRELPRQAPAAEDEPRWGAGPAETAAATLAVALAAYGPGTYARVLASGHVTAGLTPTAARQVTDALNTRPAPSGLPPRPQRRGLGHGWKGIDAGR